MLFNLEVIDILTKGSFLNVVRQVDFVAGKYSSTERKFYLGQSG